MICFNIPPRTEKEYKYVREVLDSGKISGDGIYTKKCNFWLEQKMAANKALLITSGTHALELAAILADIQPGDEVIMPSYTFVSTANAFLLRGAKIVFVDIRPDTMNIDEKRIETAITSKTKAIVPVHYAGVACEMDDIVNISEKHGIIVIEDAAQGVMSKYKGKALGTFGSFGCYSFHETKNYSMGEGGAIIVNDREKIERAEIIREKGTDRSKFLRGQIDKYSWVDKGSSYLPSDINAAVLYAQLEIADKINNNRGKSWELYYGFLEDLTENNYIELPTIPNGCEHNSHMFYIKTKDIEERQNLIQYLKEDGISAVFHYIPLHTSRMGKYNCRFDGEDLFTTKESERILRLPLYYGISEPEVKKVSDAIHRFYGVI